MDIESKEKIQEIISKFPISHSKHAVQNAFIHLKKAGQIAELDKRMSYFRVITAREEISTGIILALKMKGYQKAGDILHKSHSQKILLYNYFTTIFEHYFHILSNLKPKFLFRKYENQDKIQLLICLKNPKNGEIYFPTPPLNSYQGKKNSPSNLNEHFQDFYGEDVIEKMVDYSERICTQRNYLLYASQKGVIDVNINIDDLIEETREKIYLLASIWIIILQNDEQILIHQILDSLKEIMPKIKNDDSIKDLIKQNFIKDTNKIEKIEVELP